MIVSIETPRPSCRASLLYNEGKVLRGVAALVGYAGLQDPSRECIFSTFERFEKTRYPISQMSFHASVNPSEKDSCTEEQVLDFIAGLMDHLGYGDQPYLVYRHFDIRREHYHIVSVRADREGRKINNLFEIKRASAYMREVAQQYGFSIAEKGMRVRQERSLQERGPASGPALRFNPSKEVFSQLEDIWDEALTYDCDTLSQLAFVLEDLGVRMEIVEGDGESAGITLQGLDARGESTTGRIGEEELGKPLYDMAKTALAGAPRRHVKRYREKERVRSLVRSSFAYSRSESHFRNILRLKGVTMHLSVNDAGEPFGITFVDHTTRTVFKGSEIRDVISVAMMRDAVESGRWRAEDRGQGRGAYIRSARKTAKEDAIALRDREAGIIARVLRPIGQPHGNSWSGKTPKTEDQKIEEREIGKSGALDANFEDTRFEEKLA